MTELEKIVKTFLESITDDLKSESDSMYSGILVEFYTLDEDSHLAIVATYDEREDVIRCKLGYNTDDLQYSYDYDWMMPIDKATGQLYDTEITVTKDSIASDTKWFCDNYKILQKEYKLGNLDVCHKNN